MADIEDKARSQKPTLKTIAKMSGLAVPTVSRALNDAPDIRRDTKRLVRKIADEIGYVPNRAGVRLRTGRTNVISLVMPTEHDMMNHTARLISSVAAALRETQFHLIVTPYFPDEDPMKPVRYLVETGSADAVILNQITSEDPRIAYLIEKKFPFAAHGRTKWADQHPYYDFDNEVFADRAVTELFEKGRQNIALLAPPLDHNYARHTMDGASKAAERTGVSLKLIEDVTSDAPHVELVAEMCDFLSNNPKTDAIVCSSSSSAIAVIAAVEKQGLIIGKDIDIYAKEIGPFLHTIRADIMTCSEAVGVAGEFLARAAIQAIKEPEKPPMQHLEIPNK